MMRRVRTMRYVRRAVEELANPMPTIGLIDREAASINMLCDHAANVTVEGARFALINRLE